MKIEANGGNMNTCSCEPIMASVIEKSSARLDPRINANNK